MSGETAHGLSIEYYSAIERNEVPTLDTTWMNLKNTLSGKKNTKRQILYDPFI